MAGQTHMGSTKFPSVLGFRATDIPNANGTLATMQGTVIRYVAPYAGSIIGFSGTLSAHLTTGTLIFQPTIDGSLCPVFPDAASLRTNQSKSYYSQQARKTYYNFLAGAALGVNFNASDTINATTLDAACQLVVLYESVDY